MEKKYKSFEEARAFIRSLKFKKPLDWQNYRRSDKKPDDIPYSPNITYRDQGWQGIHDWLGTKPVDTRNWRPD